MVFGLFWAENGKGTMSSKLFLLRLVQLHTIYPARRKRPPEQVPAGSTSNGRQASDLGTGLEFPRLPTVEELLRAQDSHDECYCFASTDIL